MSRDAARYLLGQLPEEDRLRLEAAYFSEGGGFEEMLAVEDELFFDYVAGQLSPADRAAFEQRFLADDAGRRKLAFAGALVEALRSAQTKGDTLPAATAVAPPTHRPLTFWALAAAAAIFASTSAWLARDLMRAREDLNAAQAQRAGATAAVPTVRPLSVVAFTLAGGLTRADSAARRLQIPAGINTVRFVIETGSAGTSRVTIRTAEGNEVWSQSAQQTPEAGAITIDVNAGVLTTADYEIVVDFGPGKRPLSYTFTAIRP
jgi:hypothetical protein